MVSLDALCLTAIKKNPDSAVAWFLITSLLYYQHDVSIIGDDVYDHMCKSLLARWPDVKHPHKEWIEKYGDLEAGSGYALPFSQLPSIVHGAAMRLKKESGQ